jgi:hypothetical protein
LLAVIQKMSVESEAAQLPGSAETTRASKTDPNDESRARVVVKRPQFEARPMPLSFVPLAALSVDVSPDGKTLAVARGMFQGLFQGPGELVVWDLATGEQRYALKRRHLIRSVAFSPDGHLIATADFDGRIRLQNAATGEVVGELIGNVMNSVALDEAAAPREGGAVCRGFATFDALDVTVRPADGSPDEGQCWPCGANRGGEAKYRFLFSVSCYQQDAPGRSLPQWLSL